MPLPGEAEETPEGAGDPTNGKPETGGCKPRDGRAAGDGPASRSDMVASIEAVAAPAQGASYYERDGYYAKDDPEHSAASAWAGRGADELGLTGPVDPDTFRAVLEGRVPDGSDTRLGRRGKDGSIEHRPGRDLTLSAPKSVSLAALVGGDARVIDAHDRAVARTLAWFEKNVAEIRMKDSGTGRMVRTGGQKTVIATFRHDTSRNLDRWTRNDAGLGLVNSGTAEVAAVRDGRVTFRLEDGRTLDLAPGDPPAPPPRPRLGFDRARVPGPHGRYRDRGDGGQPSPPHHAEELLCRDLPRAGPCRARHRRPGGA